VVAASVALSMEEMDVLDHALTKVAGPRYTPERMATVDR